LFTNARAFIHNAPAAGWSLVAAGSDTALRAVLTSSPGLVLSDGSEIGPESKPAGRIMLHFMNNPG
jgi:hypothetical protein